MTDVIDRHAIDAMAARVRVAYGVAVGRSRAQLVTPALVLDIDKAQRNIDLMAARLRSLPAGIRPHVKVHKSPELARRQMTAGALGVSTATVWEAIVMAEAGIDDIFVVNTIVGDVKLRAVAELARSTRLRVAVDSLDNARAISAAAEAARSTVGLMIEVDTGMDRCGVDTIEQAIDLARRVDGLPHVRFDGLTGYEGHCSLTSNRDLRLAMQQAAIAFLVQVADAIQAGGMPVTVLSAGGTATWDLTASNPRMTEIQAGTYVVMDNFHGQMISGFAHALTVQTAVISTPTGRLVVDAGSKSVGDGELSTIVGSDAKVVRFDEEHGVFTADRNLRAGDSVALIPGYAPSTVNLYDAYFVVRDDMVVDVWPVIPRGPGHGGLVIE